MLDKSNYSRTCFVIMPFGKKKIGENDFDFDDYYEKIFKRAIEMTALPEGGKLTAKRADSKNVSGSIRDEMLQDILLSRIVFADITGLNPNVFYELGVRHALRPMSTVVFKEKKSVIPFDVQDLRIFDYEVEGVTAAIETIDKIKVCLEESLLVAHDSPVVKSLRDELEWPDYDYLSTEKFKIRSYYEIKNINESIRAYLRDADFALEKKDLSSAISLLKGARNLDNSSLEVNMRLSSLLIKKNRLDDAEEILNEVIKIYPKYSSCWRLLGVVKNKLNKSSEAIDMFKKSLELNPSDSEIWCNLGGIYKKLEEYDKALNAYKKGLNENPESTYALLNYLLLQAINSKSKPDITKHKSNIESAKMFLENQIDNGWNLPWCYYDLAQLYFFQGNMDNVFSELEQGVKVSTTKWQIESAKKTYDLLKNANIYIDETESIINKFDELLEKYKL